jgi:hypothetical protein
VKLRRRYVLQRQCRCASGVRHVSHNSIEPVKRYWFRANAVIDQSKFNLSMEATRMPYRYEVVRLP